MTMGESAPPVKINGVSDRTEGVQRTSELTLTLGSRLTLEALLSGESSARHVHPSIHSLGTSEPTHFHPLSSKLTRHTSLHPELLLPLLAGHSLHPRHPSHPRHHTHHRLGRHVHSGLVAHDRRHHDGLHLGCESAPGFGDVAGGESLMRRGRGRGSALVLGMVERVKGEYRD